MWDLHVAAYYGNYLNFLEYYHDGLGLEYKTSLHKCLLHGCKINKHLALFCYKNFILHMKKLSPFVAICIFHGVWFSDLEVYEDICLYLDYISEESLLNMINYSKKYPALKEVCVYLSILNEYDFLDKIENWKEHLNSFSEKLINNLNMTDFDFKEFHLMNYPYSPIRSEVMRDDRIVEKDMFDPDSLNSFPNFNMRSCVIHRFLKYGEICEDDDAICGRIDRNEAISTLFFYDPEYAVNLLYDEKPDLVFNRMIIPPIDWPGLYRANEKYLYKALYSCIAGGYRLRKVDLKDIKYVDKDCLEIAKEKCNGYMLKFFKEMDDSLDCEPSKFKIRR